MTKITKKKDKIDEIMKIRRKERIRDEEGLTKLEAEKKHIPIYRAKPLKLPEGDIFADFTIVPDGASTV